MKISKGSSETCKAWAIHSTVPLIVLSFLILSPLLDSIRMLFPVLFLFVCLFMKERGRKGQREGEKHWWEKHWLVASCMHLDQGPNLQPRRVPWLGIKWRPFAFQDILNQLSHMGQALFPVFTYDSRHYFDLSLKYWSSHISSSYTSLLVHEIFFPGDPPLIPTLLTTTNILMMNQHSNDGPTSSFSLERESLICCLRMVVSKPPESLCPILEVAVWKGTCFCLYPYASTSEHRRHNVPHPHYSSPKEKL